MKFTLVLTTLVGAAFAIPPACLLHGVNTQDNPSDLSAICGTGATQVQSYLYDNCGNNQDSAQKAFIATCSSAGTSVAAYTPTATSGSGSGTRGSGSATGSGSGASNTNAANSLNSNSLKSGSGMAAAAIALVGAVAAL